jgi:hypothetical protein
MDAADCGGHTAVCGAGAAPPLYGKMLMSGRPRLILVSPSLHDGNHRAVPPRRRCAKAVGTVAWPVQRAERGANILLFESYAAYERESEEDDYRQRMVANCIVFVVTLTLIACGTWLAVNII